MRYQVVAYMTDLFTQKFYPTDSSKKPYNITKVGNEWKYPKIAIENTLNAMYKRKMAFSDCADYYYVVEEQ
jgi:hypothetical protein